MRRVSLAATATYAPERWLNAAELATVSGIEERVLVERFGLRGKHVAAPDEHVSDMAVNAARSLLAEHDMAAASLDAVVYFGSTFKDHPVWQAAPDIAHRLGAGGFALELDYVSCGSPVAVRVVRDMMLAEPEINSVLAVGACRESYLIDYTNDRSRFMFNFGDGAVAALFTAGTSASPRREVLGTHMLTDGSFARDVLVPAGGSVEPATCASVAARRHYLDVPDPTSMKARLDPVSLANFVAAAHGAASRSGATLGEVAWLCGIHMKRSMHDTLCAALGVPTERSIYLDDTGHMSGLDPLYALDRADRSGCLTSGDLILLLAAGTGYTWAAACVRW